MLYMVVETFKDKDEIYKRFREKGRITPDDLSYVSSWIDENMTKCFQLMETDNFDLFDEWTSNWSDPTDFEIIPVITSEEAVRKNINEQNKYGNYKFGNTKLRGKSYFGRKRDFTKTARKNLQ